MKIVICFMEYYNFMINLFSFDSYECGLAGGWYVFFSAP